MTRRPRLNYTHASHTHEPYYSHQTCKTKLCIESHSTGLCVGYEIHGATHTAVDVFGNHRSHLNSDHAEFFDLADLIDHRESDSGLRFTVNPDGRYRPVGVGCVTTSLTPIIRKHSHIDPHVQLTHQPCTQPISSTTTDLIYRLHISNMHTIRIQIL